MKQTLIFVSLLGSLAALAGVSWIVGQTNASGETVRIIARLQADGDIEFGLRTSEGNQLPRLRVFSASIADENWKRSSTVELSGGAEVRIIARRDGDARVEFGLRIDKPFQEFLPARRFFPRSARVGRWLSSTPIVLPAPDAAEVQDDPGTTPPGSEEPPTEPAETDEDGQGNPLANTEWRLVALGDADAPVEAVGDATAEFTTDTNMTGWTGCNSYGARYRVADSELRLDELTWTEAGCPSQALFRQEQRMQDSLATVERFEVSGERLTLHSEGRQALVFERVGK